jgi:hypothetical protein
MVICIGNRGVGSFEKLGGGGQALKIFFPDIPPIFPKYEKNFPETPKNFPDMTFFPEIKTFFRK